MRARLLRGRWSVIAGWLMVSISCIAVIGTVLAVLESPPAVAAGASSEQSTQTTVRYEESATNVSLSGSWRTSRFTDASAGSEIYAWRSGTSATITFTGSSLSLISTKSFRSGIARVTLDNQAPVLVDLYAAKYAHQQTVHTATDLAAGTHQLTIEWTGMKNAKAKGTLVYLDAVAVTTSVSVNSPTTVAGVTTTTAAPSPPTTMSGIMSTTTTAAAPKPTTTTTTAAPAATTTTTTAAPTTTTTAAPAPATTTTAAPAATTTTTAAPTPTPVATVYNVLNYGAKANGVTDDANAIQAAVNAAHGAGGGTVYLPAGTYRLYAARSVDPDLGANVELFDNITIKGAGSAATIVVADRDWASAFGAVRRNNVSVQDLTMTAGASKQDGVKFGVCTEALVQNVVVHDIYIGVAFYSCTDPVARNVKAYDCWGAGVWIAQGETWPEPSIGGLIEDCEAWGNNFISFRVDGKATAQVRATGVTLRRNYSHTDGSVAFLFTYAESITVDRCTSTNTGYNGILFGGVIGATLTGSTAPFVTTADNNASMYDIYGASSGIVVR